MIFWCWVSKQGDTSYTGMTVQPKPFRGVTTKRNFFFFQEKLMAAIQEGSYDRCKMCVHRGANVNFVNEVKIFFLLCYLFLAVLNDKQHLGLLNVASASLTRRGEASFLQATAMKSKSFKDGVVFEGRSKNWSPDKTHLQPSWKHEHHGEKKVVTGGHFSLQKYLWEMHLTLVSERDSPGTSGDHALQRRPGTTPEAAQEPRPRRQSHRLRETQVRG